MTKTIPEYLKYEEGFCDIALKGGLTISGAKVTVLRMREPDLNDQLALDDMKGSEAAKEIGFFSNLCQIAPDELRTLKLRDYGRIQAAFKGFLD